MLKSLIFLAGVLACGRAFSADQPLYGSAPAWVTSIPIPEAVKPNGQAAFQVLLQDGQSSFGSGADEFYSEYAIKVLSPEGLAAVGAVTQAWNPDTETVTFNKLKIIRGDRVIDLLAAGKKFTVLRRETNLELAALDGTLTATMQLEDVRVGDVGRPGLRRARGGPSDLGRRRLVQLRLEHIDKASADYDAALDLRPQTPQSLYGRRIARLRKGQKDAGGADIAAATKLDPTVAATFAGYGVRP